MSDGSIDAEELRDSIRQVLGTEGDLGLVRLEPEKRRTALADLWQEIASLGWLGLAIPEQYGGLGLGYRPLCLLYEELGRFLMPLPVMPTLLAADAVALAGSEAQRRHWLALFAVGKIRASLALPTAAVDLPQLHEDHTVTGGINDVLHGADVDEVLVPLQDAAGRLYIGIFSSVAAGITIQPRAIIDLTRTLADVRIENAVAQDDRLLSIDAGIWSALLDHASLAMVCDAVGGTARILSDTVAYLCERRQFGRPIGAFQALKHRAASWKIEAEGSTALARHCADLIADLAIDRSGMVSAAKARVTDLYVKVAGDAVQLHGGIGFTWEHECHLFLKRAVLDAALFGTVTQHKDRAARLLFAPNLGPLATPHKHEAVRRFFHG